MWSSSKRAATSGRRRNEPRLDVVEARRRHPLRERRCRSIGVAERGVENPILERGRPPDPGRRHRPDRGHRASLRHGRPPSESRRRSSIPLITLAQSLRSSRRRTPCCRHGSVDAPTSRRPDPRGTRPSARSYQSRNSPSSLSSRKAQPGHCVGAHEERARRPSATELGWCPRAAARSSSRSGTARPRRTRGRASGSTSNSSSCRASLSGTQRSSASSRATNSPYRLGEPGVAGGTDPEVGNGEHPHRRREPPRDGGRRGPRPVVDDDDPPTASASARARSGSHRADTRPRCMPGSRRSPSAYPAGARRTDSRSPGRPRSRSRGVDPVTASAP